MELSYFIIESYSYRLQTSRNPALHFIFKVLIGCDGVKSIVSKWLGLDKPVDSGRSALRGTVEFPDGHGFGPKFLQYIGNGVRLGVIPCGPTTLYWFLTYAPSIHGKPVN